MPSSIEIRSTIVVVVVVVAVDAVVDSTLVTCPNGVKQIRDIFVEKNNKLACFFMMRKNNV